MDAAIMAAVVRGIIGRRQGCADAASEKPGKWARIVLQDDTKCLRQ